MKRRCFDDLSLDRKRLGEPAQACPSTGGFTPMNCVNADDLGTDRERMAKRRRAMGPFSEAHHSQPESHVQQSTDCAGKLDAQDAPT